MSACDFFADFIGLAQESVQESAQELRRWNGRLEKVNLSVESSGPVMIVAMTWFTGDLPASAAERRASAIRPSV